MRALLVMLLLAMPLAVSVASSAQDPTSTAGASSCVLVDAGPVPVEVDSVLECTFTCSPGAGTLWSHAESTESSIQAGCSSAGIGSVSLLCMYGGQAETLDECTHTFETTFHAESIGHCRFTPGAVLPTTFAHKIACGATWA